MKRIILLNDSLHFFNIDFGNLVLHQDKRTSNGALFSGLSPVYVALSKFLLHPTALPSPNGTMVHLRLALRIIFISNQGRERFCEIALSLSFPRTLYNDHTQGLKCIWHEKYFLVISKAFQSTDEWRFSFWNIFLRFRDIDVFLLFKLDKWRRHTVCNWKVASC